jgi:DHA1 family bicyclomycin/chloramphenicol resistance-like MFS transporter
VIIAIAVETWLSPFAIAGGLLRFDFRIVLRKCIYYRESMTATNLPPDRRRNLVIILILGALSTVSPFAIDMYLPAFGQIASDLGTTPARIALSISSYFIGLSIGQIFYGPFLDRFGRKKPLALGLLIYIFAALAITRVHSLEGLVLLRFLQALGGGAASVASVAMVRDFFPVEEGAKVFSLLMLILGVSPLLAPTVGGFLVVTYGWHMVFFLLAGIVSLILAAAFFVLPAGPPPDRDVNLEFGPIARTFGDIFKQPQFFTYAVAGALSFGGLFVYVAGSPILFMDVFKVSPKVYGGIFAMLSIGFIGSSQLNLLFSKRYTSEAIFKFAISFQAVVSLVFFIVSYFVPLGLPAILVLLFLSLSSLGTASPNAAILALAPFDRNVGSASALLGFLQIGVGAIASTGVGLLDSGGVRPIVALLAASASLSVITLYFGPTSDSAHKSHGDVPRGRTPSCP